MPQHILAREVPGMDEEGIKARLQDEERAKRAIIWINNLDGNRLHVAIRAAKEFGTEKDIIDFVDENNAEDPRGFASWIMDHHGTIKKHISSTNEAFMDNARQLALSTSHERAGIVARWFLDRVRQGLIDTDSRSFTSVNTAIFNEITRDDEDGEWPAIEPVDITIGTNKYRMIQVDREGMLAAARTIHQHYGTGPITKGTTGSTAIQIDETTYIAQAQQKIIKAHENETMATFIVGDVSIEGTSCLVALWVEDGEWQVANASSGLRWAEDPDKTGEAVLEYLRKNIIP